MTSIISRDYFGFGDNIYKRPFIKELAKHYDEVFLYTAFPELFTDIPNVKFCRPTTQLKTQEANMLKHDKLGTWTQDTPYGQEVKVNYSRYFREGGNVIENFNRVIPLTGKFAFNLPDIKAGKEKALEVYNSIPKDKKLCIVRLPSVRTEWECESRNAKMEYFTHILENYNKEFYFLSIGDICDNESFCGIPPLEHLDYRYHLNGQLDVFEVINLMRLADLTISIPCFTLPLSIALNTPAFFIYGGYVKHELLVDSRMDLSKIGYIQPNPFCNCVNSKHFCNKEIDKVELLKQFERFICQNKFV